MLNWTLLTPLHRLQQKSKIIYIVQPLLIISSSFSIISFLRDEVDADPNDLLKKQVFSY